MTALVEFALFAWVAISVVAVLVQLVRLARYKRSARSTATSRARTTTTTDDSTIDLAQRLATPAPTRPAADVAPTSDEFAGPARSALANTAARTTEPTMGGRAPSVPTADAASSGATQVLSGTATETTATETTATETTATETTATETTATEAATATTATETPTDVPVASAAAPVTPPAPQPAPAPTTAQEAAAERATLADLLTGVRLPWNLLPTVDHGRRPSNHRVALITDQGEPGQIGVDVADELERLGFTITPQGEDTAIATKEGRSLGLRIIPNPAQAEIDGQRRFPHASEHSVALDIWIE